MDVVVTVPKNFRHGCAPHASGLIAWLAEGDAPSETPTDIEWGFSVGGRPEICPGERVYVVCEERLVGYSPLVRLTCDRFERRCELIRAGGSVACTIQQRIIGFRGFRYRWWETSVEVPLDLSREVAAAQAARTYGWDVALAGFTKAR